MKYYGVFHFTAQSWAHKEHLLGLIYYGLIKNDDSRNHELIAMNKNNLAKSRSDERLKQFAANWRNWYNEDRKRSLCHMFSSRYVIHQCDENGLYIPSKKEIADAIALYEKNDANQVEA